MSPRRKATEPEAVELLAKLDGLTAEAAEHAARGEQLMADRNALFVALKALGVTHREIAEHSDLTEMAVKKAIDKTVRDAA